MSAEEYMRQVDQRRLPTLNRGASQTVIEKNTFPHKYKMVFIFLFLSYLIIKKI